MPFAALIKAAALPMPEDAPVQTAVAPGLKYWEVDMMILSSMHARVGEFATAP